MINADDGLKTKLAGPPRNLRRSKLQRGFAKMFSWTGVFWMGNENAAFVRYRSDSLNPIAGNSKCKYWLVTFLIEKKITSGAVVNKIVEGEKYRRIMSLMIPDVKFVESGNSARKLSEMAKRATLVWAIKDQYINNRSTKRANRNLPADSLAVNN